MNQFTLSFQTRQLQIRTNFWIVLHTRYGDFIVQYVPCSESFTVSGCWKWTYTFCYQETDVPSGLDICNLTSNVLVPPYLTAIPPIFLEDTLTVDVQGNGSELLPYNFNVIIDPDIDNTIQARADGLFSGGGSGGGIPGPKGDKGDQGDQGEQGEQGEQGIQGNPGDSGTSAAVGLISYVAGSISPESTLPMNGQLILRLEYPLLWLHAMNSNNLVSDGDWLADPENVGHYSSGDGATNFRLPRLNGYFIRSWNSDDVIGPDEGRLIGTTQGDAIRNITGDILPENVNWSNDNGALQIGAAVANQGTAGVAVPGNTLEFDASLAPDVVVADENRPINIALMAVVQAE